MQSASLLAYTLTWLESYVFFSNKIFETQGIYQYSRHYRGTVASNSTVGIWSKKYDRNLRTLVSFFFKHSRDVNLWTWGPFRVPLPWKKNKKKLLKVLLFVSFICTICYTYEVLKVWPRKLKLKKSCSISRRASRKHIQMQFYTYFDVKTPCKIWHAVIRHCV
jgi:hypothetical protein